MLFCFVFLFVSAGSYCYADNEQKARQVEQKRLQIRKKISLLSRLERKETNKLSRNQQKLERNQRALERSKNQFSQKQSTINVLQKELNQYLAEYNTRNKASAERLRCIYKNKNTLILDLLLSTSSISEFLDRIYYQNLIIQSDIHDSDIFL